MLRKIFRWRIFFLALAALIVWDWAKFTYRWNNVCEPGDHIIESDTDAIKLAQTRIIHARYGSHGIPGYIDEKPGFADFSRSDCCSVSKSRNVFGVIVWEVYLRGETVGEPKTRNVSALVQLSNCGEVFRDESFISADPPG